MKSGESDSSRQDHGVQTSRSQVEQPFAAPQQQFDLNKVTARLKDGFESSAGRAGHRQEALFKHGPTTVALYLFAHLARLPPHRAKGVVIIQVLDGRIEISAEGNVHDLHAGQLLMLASGVEHTVVAKEDSRMLLIVHLDVTTESPST
ncbi:MAG: cupin domain-containing protein [Planctomycetia bacterium]|nr:cupin domain-containing protein [Planctomycetia bacterium]MCC7315670.1 cupin domain-containing protein [Planctomycetota bacterium]OQZ05840.1 MAG: hypothetical protein B6D36_08115 [Planctomycetes bacterium UTPLA1]